MRGAPLVALLSLLCLAPTAQAAPTIVTLQFDDAHGQESARAMLAEHGMRATFFVNSGNIGTRDFFTWEQLHELASDGHEIAGHTLSHHDLAGLAADEQRREVCGDRNALIAQGFRPTNFAYPGGALDRWSRRVVRECGYASGRAVGGLRSLRCGRCPSALDPARIADRWALETAGAPTIRFGVEDVREAVVRAQENGGGWVQILWHRLCPDRCNPYSWHPDAFDAFLTWLASERAAGRVEVSTSQEVLGGAFRPPVEPPAPPAPPNGPNRVRNPSLERTASGKTVCWERRGGGSWRRVKGAGGRGRAVEVSTGPDRSLALVVMRDQGQCSAAVRAGERLVASAAYRSGHRLRIVVWKRSHAGGWSSWRQSRELAPTGSRWRRASVQLPPIPEGVTALSVGVGLAGVGRFAVDDVALTPG